MIIKHPKTLLTLVIAGLLILSSCGAKNMYETQLTVVSSEELTEKEFNHLVNQLKKRLNNYEISFESIQGKFNERRITLRTELESDNTKSLNQIVTSSVRIQFRIVNNESSRKLPFDILKQIHELESFQLFSPQFDEYGPVPMTVLGHGKNESFVTQINEMTPTSFKNNYKFSCSMYNNEQGLRDYYIIEKPVNKTHVFSPYSIESCEVVENETGLSLQVKLNQDNDPTWEVFTANNVRNQLAILINGQVLFAPMINAKISGNEFTISGHFNIEEAEIAANLINMGHIPHALQISKQEKVSK